MKRFFLSTVSLCLALAVAPAALADTLKKPDIDKLVALPAVRSAPDAAGTAITAMAGAPAANAVPQTATASLKGGDLSALAAKLDAAKAAFVQKAG